MKIVTELLEKTRNETMATTTYKAMVKFTVTDIERENGTIGFEEWITTWFPYIPVEIMWDMMNVEVPECGEHDDDTCDCS